MKTKFIHVGKRTLSVVLSIMMIVSTMLIGTITSVSALSYSEPIFYLIGSFTGSNWDTNQTSYKIEKSYQNITGKFYIEVNVPSGTSASSPAYFALYKTDGSSARYAPATQHTEVGSTAVQGDYDHSSNSWIYTGSASKIRICVDQRSDDSDYRYYPYVWIEEVSATAPAEVLSGNDVMFYVRSWNTTLYLKNKDKASKDVTNVKDGYGYIQISRKDAENYIYISNSDTWDGNKNVSIIHANGGELFDGQKTYEGQNLDGSYIPATTGTTTFADSKTEFTQGTDTSTTLTTTFSNGTKSSYGDCQLYVQYYVDETLVNSDQLAATSSTNYSLDLTSYSVGSHTLKTVLTDGNIYYLSGDKITFNINKGSSSYYVTGRFRVKDSSGNPTQIDWNTTNKTEPFKFQSVDGKDGVYSLATNCTLKDLSEQIHCTDGDYWANQYFYIYDGTTLYNAQNKNLENVTERSPQTLTADGVGDDKMCFGATTDTSTDKVTLMLDTTGDNLKLWYTTDGGTTTSYNITASAYDNTKGTVTVDGSTLAPSGQTTTSNSSISIAVTPTAGNVIQSLSIGGSAITLEETEKTSGYTDSSYPISGDTAIDVVFATSTVTTGSYTLYKYEETNIGTDTDLNETVKTPLSATTMTYVENDGDPYYYVEITGNGNDEYLYNIKSNDDTYYYQTSNPSTRHPGFQTINADVNAYSSWKQQFKTNGAGKDPFYIVFSPAKGTDNAEICVATSLSVTPTPDPDPDTYTVTMEQGISTPRTTNGTTKAMGSSYLDNVNTQTAVTKSIKDLTVTFTTQTTDVSADETTLGYTGKYMYQVYGYSINMNLDNGDSTTSTRVASVVNSLVDSNSAKPISALANGVYTCEYTFPSNIISATVTPIFSVSADYAKEKSITYTAVYLKMTPGSNLLGNATEPKYYTWRAKANGDDDPTPYLVGDKNLEREPEGAYGGQKMLYIGNDMYVAYVQSDLYGILFDNGTPQTFDFNEFIKLQKLGYNNITFEPKSSTQSVASTLHNSYNANGVRKYEDSAQQTVEITTENVNNEFELDVDIEGYYIDVFGNKLIDIYGNAIKRSDFVAKLDNTSVSSELSELLTITGASTEIYGARYGYYNRPDSDYGMRYSVYNYYVSGGETKKLISQQVSGYGTIEGAMSPKNSSKTNAAYQASLSNSDNLTYFDDSTNPTSKKTFDSGYELIPETYKGAPYLVSYKTTSDNRTDGKWYYMNTTPQVTVNVKTSLLNSNGSLNMSSAGKIVENKTPGTATVNYKSFDTIDQGTSAVMRATPNEGFAFVGFYEENGDFISKYNPYGNKVFAVDTTVYAVFKEVADGSVTITNSPYDSALSNPTPGGGNGKVSVTLVITPRDDFDEQGNPVYGTPVSYTGETSVSAPIKDGDKFHIILTGERSGADNFLAFRMPDKDFVGNLYYVALDDAQFLNVTKDPKGKAISAIYKTEDMVWDWTEQLGTTVTPETKRAKTFSYYTDFSKTDINATLEYRYKDRFGNWKTYIVKNVPMDVSQINEGNYVPDDTLVLKYAPPIDEVFNSCSWKAADIDARNSYALLEADQTFKTFKTYVDRNADDINSPNELIVAPFNESIQIEAPETKGSATFKYWKRYLLDSKGDISGSGEIFSNMRSISIKVTFDSVFVPVYDEVSDTYFTNVQDAKYTREKSTDDKGVVYDYVYADFLLQFDTLEGNDTFKNIVASNPGKIKFGVILEMDYNYTYNPTAENPGFTAPTTDNDLLKETIENLNTGLAEGGHKSDWNATSNSQLAQYNYYYNLYDLTDKASNLSNFGRYDYFFKFANTEANRARVYNAYSYIIIYNDNNQIDQIIVSNPKTLSIYATGIKNDGSTSEKIDTTESV